MIGDRRPHRGAAANYELLRDAYAILGGIPTEVVDLDRIETRAAGGIGCGTIACGIGWLAHHPQFQELGLQPESNIDVGQIAYKVAFKGKAVDYDEAGMKVFNLTRSEAEDLFGPVADPWGRDRPRKIHKNILLNRIKKLLIKSGQPVNDRTLLSERM